MRLSTWVLCNFIVCVFCFRSTAGGTCNSDSDCNSELRGKCCSGNCKRRISCNGYCWSDEHCDTSRGEICEQRRCTATSTRQPTVVHGTCNSDSDCNSELREKCCSGNCKRRISGCGYCLRDEHCDTSRGERCEQRRCTATSTRQPTVVHGTCNSDSDCNSELREKCCGGNCKRRMSCRGYCWSDEHCDTLRGERCDKATCKNISTSINLTEDFGNNESEQEEYSSSGISGGKVFLLTVLPIVAFLAAALIYCKRSRRLQTPPSNGETTEARQPTQTNIPDEVSSHEVVVINMENPWRPDAPPPYHTLAFDVNQAADQEPAPPSYEEAVRNSTDTLV